MRGWRRWAARGGLALVTADQWRTSRTLVAGLPDESAGGRVRLVADGGGLENR